MSDRRARPRSSGGRSRPSGAELLVEAGAGTGKTGVMVDRYCRLVCDEGVSPDAVLAFTFTDKAAAELRQRIRAEIELRADDGLGARPRAAPRARQRLGDDDPRLLQPPALGPPGGRSGSTPASACSTRRRPSARPARPSTRRSRSSSREAGDEREDTVAAFDVGGLRGMVIGAHAELRSRGEAEPRLPEPPDAGPAGALRRAAEVAAERGRRS